MTENPLAIQSIESNGFERYGDMTEADMDRFLEYLEKARAVARTGIGAELNAESVADDDSAPANPALLE